MANKWLVASGDVSVAANWNSGTLPTANDDIYSNGFTGTFTASASYLSVSNAATTGVNLGGGFIVSAGVTITATSAGFIQGATNTSLITASFPSGSSASCVGSFVYPSGVTNAVFCCNNASSGTLNLTGSAFNNSTRNGGDNGAIGNTSVGTINYIGDARAGTNGVSPAIVNVSGGVINMTGNAFGNAGYAVINQSSGTVNLTGNSIAASSAGCYNASIGGTFVINGQIIASTSAPGFEAASASSTNILTGPFLVASNGTHAVYARRWFWLNTGAPATYMQVRTADLTVVRSLFTPDSVGGNPAANNVRAGITFGPNNELTGTCAVPPAESVALGVPVGNSTGTAALTAANIRAAMGLASANLDTQLAAIPAGTRAEMDSNSSRLVNLDAAVSTRSTLTAGQVRTELASELTRVSNCATVETVGAQLAQSLNSTP